MADFGPHDNLPRFELGPANPGPTLTINRQAPARDVLDVLPAGAPRKRWITLNQRVADTSAAKISFDQQKAAAEAVTAHRRRVDDLLRPRNEGCLYGVAENSPFVAEREKLARAEVERDRLKKLGDVRSVRWNQYGNLRNRIADWVLRGGVSGGCELASVDDPPLTKLLTKGETLGEAVGRDRAQIASARQRRSGPRLHHGRSPMRRRRSMS